MHFEVGPEGRQSLGIADILEKAVPGMGASQGERVPSLKRTQVLGMVEDGGGKG